MTENLEVEESDMTEVEEAVTEAEPAEEIAVESELQTEAEAENPQEEQIQAHTEVTDKAVEGPETMVWPWVLGGLVVLLTIIAAFLVCRKKRNKRTAAQDASVEQAQIGGFSAPMGKSAVYVGTIHGIGARESQQDSFGISPSEMLDTYGMLAVVADGMGGLKDGDKVSKLVVSTMLDAFSSVTGYPQGVLLALLGQVNVQVNYMLGEYVGRSGSTLVAGLAKDGYFHYVSIGDSRICLFRNGQLMQLNREHIFRNDLAVRALNGIGTLQDAFTNPKGGGLTSFIGMGQLKYVDIPAQPVKILANDKFILMSDGVFNALTEEEMIGALRAAPEQAAEQIGGMIAAKAFRNQDNYTAVILGF